MSTCMLVVRQLLNNLGMELSSTDLYTWAPLQSSRHTRLLQIHPSESFKQPIECDIITTSIDEPCKYRALSYAWGDIQQDGSHLNATIYCDGKPMRVTQHLNMALKRIRASTKTWYRKLPIWIDAISIAQDDPKEKAQQVRMISEIFGKCRHLTIWLGEIDTREDDLCRKVATKSNQWEDEGMEVELNFSEQAFLDTVLERSWFQRRWIIQEVLIANTSGLTPLFRLGEHGPRSFLDAGSPYGKRHRHSWSFRYPKEQCTGFARRFGAPTVQLDRRDAAYLRGRKVLRPTGPLVCTAEHGLGPREV
jgi:hypothetical protein